MAEPFKEMFNEALVSRLADALQLAVQPFDRTGFTGFILDKQWKSRELKDRMKHIAGALNRFLPGTFEEKVRVLSTVAPDFRGFPAILFSDFVERAGLDHFDVSIRALQTFTPLASSEFAVRPFILKYPVQMMQVIGQWTADPDEHVRRLASEGCRPRLPWAMALPEFKKNPVPVLRVLEKLMCDPSEYVRRSVANNLNDISKDHPETVKDFVRPWLGTSPETNSLIHHALRTLLKKGDAEALALTGIEKNAQISLDGFSVAPTTVYIGGETGLDVRLRNDTNFAVPVRIEYAVTFVNRSGRGGRKVFQWKKTTLQADGQAAQFQKKHRFADVSIRKHFAGPHLIECIVNGSVLASTTVDLL